CVCARTIASNWRCLLPTLAETGGMGIRFQARRASAQLLEDAFQLVVAVIADAELAAAVAAMRDLHPRAEFFRKLALQRGDVRIGVARRAFPGRGWQLRQPHGLFELPH